MQFAQIRRDFYGEKPKEGKVREGKVREGNGGEGDKWRGGEDPLDLHPRKNFLATPLSAVPGETEERTD